jgi:hypothetical protein
MCFGNSTTTSSTSGNGASETTPNSTAVTNLTNENANAVAALQTNGFQPDTQQQVATLSPQQVASQNAANTLANSTAQGGTLNDLAMGAATPISTNGITANNVSSNSIASNMSPYMNAYVGDALAPQVSNLNNQEALQSQLTQGQATSSGAFGDPRATMLQQNQNAQNSLQEQGLVGSAYTSAFNTAIGAGAQDSANQLSASTTNANNSLTAAQDTAANSLTAQQDTNTDKLAAANSVDNMQTNAATLQNTMGQQSTAQNQAQLNANYNQWLLAQQYPLQAAQLANQTEVSGAVGGGTSSQTASNGTTTAPDNSGFAMLGSVVGAFLADGGKAKGGKPVVVGERGPEVFIPHTDGIVIPHEIWQAAQEKRDAKIKSQAPSGLARQLGIAG